MTATVRAPLEVTLQPHLIAKAITIYDPERYMEKREPLG